MRTLTDRLLAPTARRTWNGVCFVLLLVVLAPAHAQIELSASAGYQFWGKANAREGRMSIKPAANFQATAGYRLAHNLVGELSYIHQPTALRLKARGTGETAELFDMAVHYFQIGAMYEMDTGGGFVPFGGAMVGASLFNPKEKGIGNEWLFAFSLTGGFKIPLSSGFGLRAQGNLLFPVQWSGGGLWCGLGGCNIGVGARTSIIQGAVTGGLYVAF